MSLDHIKPPKNFKYHNHLVLLTLHFEFTADNRIFFNSSQYKDLLNHHYQFDVTINSPINELGLGIDFFEVKNIYNEHIKPHVHEQLLNESLPDMNTTVENIAYYLWQQFSYYLPGNNQLHSLTLYETPQHSVKLTHELMTE